MSDRTKIARIAASIEANAAHANLARNGGLKLTIAQPAVAQRLPSVPKRRTPSLPRIALDNGPAPERAAKAPGGIDRATGSRAHRVRGTVDAVAERLTDEEMAAARCFVADYLTAEAGARQRITVSHDGVPAIRWGPRDGGVMDQARTAFTTMALACATMDRRFWNVLEMLAVGVRRELDGRPWTLEEIGRAFLPKPYEKPGCNRAVAVGLLKSSLWRVAEFYRRERALTKKRLAGP